MASQLCFTLPANLLNAFKEYCEANDLNQSELIRHLIRTEIYHEKSLDKGQAEEIKKK